MANSGELLGNMWANSGETEETIYKTPRKRLVRVWVRVRVMVRVVGVNGKFGRESGKFGRTEENLDVLLKILTFIGKFGRRGKNGCESLILGLGGKFGRFIDFIQEIP